MQLFSGRTGRNISGRVWSIEKSLNGNTLAMDVVDENDSRINTVHRYFILGKIPHPEAILGKEVCYEERKVGLLGLRVIQRISSPQLDYDFVTLPVLFWKYNAARRKVGGLALNNLDRVFS